MFLWVDKLAVSEKNPLQNHLINVKVTPSYVHLPIEKLEIGYIILLQTYENIFYSVQEEKSI